MKLDDSHIPVPCTKAWDELKGNGVARSCDTCNKDVHDLSQLTRAQADELLASNSDLCVRYATRKDGTLVLADSLVRGRASKARSLVLAAALVAGTAYVTMPPAAPRYSNDDDERSYTAGELRRYEDPPAIDDVGTGASTGGATPDSAPPKSSASPK
jgi:hypothetical protein